MKKTFISLFIFFPFIFLTSFAQNYKLFDSGQTYYFNSGNFFNSNGFNYYNWSQIKVTRFDSITGTLTDTIFYPFHTWLDTSDFNDTIQPCGYLSGPSWMGLSIRETTDSTFLLNASNDTVLMLQSALQGQTWTVMQLPAGGRIDATIDSLFFATVAGFSDSVKQIRFTVFDSTGSVISTDVLNQKVIWISKSNGLLLGISFRELPQYALLERIEPIPMNTLSDIYNFDVGDEFEYRSQCVNVFNNGEPPSWTYNKILSKWFNIAMDTVFYSIQKYGLTYQHNPTPPPLYTPVYTSGFDTLSYYINSSPLYNEVPEQNTNLKFTLYPDTGVYRLYVDSSIFNGRPVYSEVNGFYDSSDSCIYFNGFEPVFYSAHLSPGLGITETSYDYRSQASDLCRIELIWYKKGSEEWGNYVSPIAGIDDISFQNDFSLYPNPARNYCLINFNSSLARQLELYSFDGKMIDFWKSNDLSMTIDLNNIPSGSYLLRVNNSNGSVTKRITKIDSD